MQKIFSVLLNFYSSVFFVITILSFLYYSFLKKEDLAIAYLHAYLFWNIGIRGIIAYIANTYPPSALQIAKAYNWDRNTPIQTELAAYNGAIGILGIMCQWFKGPFWLATLIAGTMSCIMAECVNLINIFKEKMHPFTKEKKQNENSYIMSIALFIGMHIDLAAAIFALILGLVNLFQKTSF